MSKNTFQEHGSIWESNAKSDAKWAVLSDPHKGAGEWSNEDFFSSGDQDIEFFINKLTSLNFIPIFNGVALDFGCGLGRLTNALAKKFTYVTGVDISEEMIRQANEAKVQENCKFLVNKEPNLRQFPNDAFSFILSLIVIQHIPRPYSLYYLEELGRILCPGGHLVVQIPSSRKKTPKNFLRKIIPEKLFRLKHSLSKSDRPYVTMFGIAKSEVVKSFERVGLQIIKIEADSLGGDDWESNTYYCKKNEK